MALPTAADSVVDMAMAIATEAPATMTTVTGLTINGNLVGNADCKYVAGPLTVSSFVEADWFSATEDTASAWVVVDGDLTIDAGQVFKPAKRKLFTVVYVTGNLVLNGEISMSQRGANHSGDAYSGGLTEPVDIAVQEGVTIPALGGAGAASPGRQNTAPGLVGGTAAGASGGGGSGASRWCATYGPADAGGGPGAQGTCFSGGSGGGGARAVSSAYCAAGTYGGPGGRASVDASGWPNQGGGAGNPPLVGTYGVAGGTGTGGTLIVIAAGAISGTGTLTADGAAGANADASDNASGGGSGGGVVLALSASGAPATMTAAGGLGGTTSYAGGDGGDGSTATYTLADPTAPKALATTLSGETGLAADLSLGTRLQATLAGAANLTASLTRIPITSTDLTYSDDGYGYDGTARVVYDSPVAAVPAGIQRVKVKRVHQSLPAPTLVNGRPT